MLKSEESFPNMNRIEKNHDGRLCIGSSLSERHLQQRTSENIRRQEHHNKTQQNDDYYFD